MSTPVPDAPPHLTDAIAPVAQAAALPRSDGVLVGVEVAAMSAALAAANPSAASRKQTNASLAHSHAASFEHLLKERFGIDPDTASGGPFVPRARHYELAQTLKEALGYRFYVTVCASHWPEVKGRPEAKATPEAKSNTGDDAEHFEVATALRRVGAGSHLATWRVRLEIGEDLDSLVSLFAGADWQEREQFDLLGVRFRGHPDLRRLMMPDEWEGHPLRKDYAIETRCVPWR
jgi:NADH:ubiquinone oxidoreductase subunit C